MDNYSLTKILAGERHLYEIVPLGINCAISNYLRAKGLRMTAFPFDWNITPIQSAIELIKNGFSNFLDRNNLIFLPPVYRLLLEENGIELVTKNDIVTPTVCTKYSILFPHDFPKFYEENLEVVRTKYSRRIERLNKLLESNTHIIFIHHNEDLNDWQKEQYIGAMGRPPTNCCQGWEAELSRVLEVSYPNLTYSIVRFQYLISQVEAVNT
jgi:hypothetical protein